ncbi:hypothetical protein [Salinimicrobium xinjiangense]|uniref:hypothetical protein n=1 Tax=Salinimicrobium xinjiangense TaxID=438596 RepID=UPI0004087ACE|nr:hypothetical protein [Salinimicrobium xinjiangense]
MEKIYPLMSLPLILLLLFSCSIDALEENLNIEGEHGYNFRESKAAWDQLKKKNGNSYEYTILEQSWTGHGSETTLLVEKGKVKGRYYIAFLISDEDGSKTITDSYEEILKKDIGKHEPGAPPFTMDDLYKSCISEFLIADPDTNEVYFETDEVGIMILCGFVPIGCQDDCYRGIRISNFSWR